MILFLLSYIRQSKIEIDMAIGLVLSQCNYIYHKELSEEEKIVCFFLIFREILQNFNKLVVL